MIPAFMGNNLTLRRFSNLESATVRDPARLGAATRDIQGMIDNPLFRTRIGKALPFKRITEATAFETTLGDRAILTAAI